MAPSCDSICVCDADAVAVGVASLCHFVHADRLDLWDDPSLVEVLDVVDIIEQIS